jgi:hypothetical protein
MMSSNKMFSVLALVAPLVVGAFVVSPVTTMSEASATEQLPNLCEATRGLCEYTSIKTAPALNASVCYNGTTVTLAGAGGCAKRAYFLAYGIVVDPITNIVLPLSPLKDTCDAGYCLVGTIDAGTIVTDTPVCCNGEGDCTPADDELGCSVGDITFCENLQDNGDGSFTCLDPE